MKKIIIAACAVALTTIVNAASVSWGVSGGKSTDLGTSIYLLTQYSATYDSLEAFEDSAISVGTIAKSGPNYKVATTAVANDAVTKTGNYYLAIVNGNDITILDVSKDMAAKVYDPEAQETNPGAFTTTLTAIKGGSISAEVVPEPTSGLLLLVGIAGLALRRKQK